MSAFGRAVVLAAQARWQLLDRHGKDPRPIQERNLRRLLARSAQTAFGRTHRFARLRTPSEFAAAVPLRRYMELEPWLKRALEGERDVTWPGRVRYFAMTSGTTAGNKYLPISIDSIRQQRAGGFVPLASYLRWTKDATLLDEKAILLGSSTQLERRASGVLVGDNTGIMARHMPLIARRQYLPSARVRAIGDWDRKIEAAIDESIDQDVRVLAGTPSWFLGLFDRLLEVARKRGRRAENVHDVWPNLRLITGGGIGFEPYRKPIRERLGRHVPYVDVYNATEGGIMGVQDRCDEAAMRLLPDNGVYYELVPVSELGAQAPRRLPLWQAEIGEVYALAVTTMSGLFGYLIGDCVRFVELFPHRFVFEGRTAAFLNVTGEHVSQGEIERAVQLSCGLLGVSVRDFTVTADVSLEGGASRHIFMVEFDGPVPDLDRFARALDDKLGLTNDDYKTHRKSRAGLLTPHVCPLRPGSFDAWMRAQGKLGGQNKVPRVLLDPGRRASLEAMTAWPLLAHGAC